MNRILYLMRHGEAMPALPDQKDFDRPLAPQGAQRVQEQAERILMSQGHLDGIITSNAARGLATAGILASALGVPDNRCVKWPVLYSGDMRALIANPIPRSWAQVAMVGHNPSLSELAHFLVKSWDGSLEPGEMLGISFLSSQWMWPASGKIIFSTL
jgi:phosphohistidine phosphatase